MRIQSGILRNSTIVKSNSEQMLSVLRTQMHLSHKAPGEPDRVPFFYIIGENSEREGGHYWEGGMVSSIVRTDDPTLGAQISITNMDSPHRPLARVPLSSILFAQLNGNTVFVNAEHKDAPEVFQFAEHGQVREFEDWNKVTRFVPDQYRNVTFPAAPQPGASLDQAGYSRGDSHHSRG